ncbi:MAG: hypothetical protein IH886_14995 [Nitrospinae bacterium]|nr:hypothetical protein [Nitrospinota bacterium]
MPFDWKSIDKAYEESGNSPESWILTSKNLLISASILKDAFNNALSSKDESTNGKHRMDIMMGAFMPELMLRSFALECLFKALWLSKNNNQLVQDGKFVGVDGYKNHELKILAEKVNLYENLSEIQKRVLSVLSQFNERGRFPVLKKGVKIKELKGWCNSNHDPAFNEIVNMLHAELRK